MKIALLPGILVVVKSIMSLQLEQSQYGGVTVLRLSKYLKGKEDVDYLLVIIGQLLTSDKKHILLNLRELTEIDDAGLDALTEAHTQVKAAEGTIKLVNAAHRQTDLLILTRLAPIFASFNTEEEALKSFASDSGHFDILKFVREMNEEEKQPAPEQPTTN